MTGAQKNGYKWTSSICIHGKRIYLGTYATENNAHSMYLLAAENEMEYKGNSHKFVQFLQNHKNAPKAKVKQLIEKGIYINKNRIYSSIVFGNSSVFLGYFASEEAANNAYKAAYRLRENYKGGIKDFKREVRNLYEVKQRVSRDKSEGYTYAIWDKKYRKYDIRIPIKYSDKTIHIYIASSKNREEAMAIGTFAANHKELYMGDASAFRTYLKTLPDYIWK